MLLITLVHAVYMYMCVYTCVVVRTCAVLGVYMCVVCVHVSVC